MNTLGLAFATMGRMWIMARELAGLGLGLVLGLGLGLGDVNYGS